MKPTFSPFTTAIEYYNTIKYPSKYPNYNILRYELGDLNEYDTVTVWHRTFYRYTRLDMFHWLLSLTINQRNTISIEAASDIYTVRQSLLHYSVYTPLHGLIIFISVFKKEHHEPISNS